MLNATEAQDAFLTAITENFTPEQMESDDLPHDVAQQVTETIKVILSDFHAFLIHTYGQDVNPEVEASIWEKATEDSSDKGFHYIEDAYADMVLYM